MFSNPSFIVKTSLPSVDKYSIDSAKFILQFAVRFAVHHKIEQPNERLAHFAAVNDQIEHSVFEQKFGTLKTFRKFLADCLFDHARSGKAD